MKITLPVKVAAPAAPTKPSALDELRAKAAALTAKAVATAPAEPAAPPELPATPELAERNPELLRAVQDLSNALHTAQPGIEHWLDRIHEQLRAYPELLHILTPEQIGAICKAWQAKTQVAVVKAAAKTRSTAKAAKLGVKLSDEDL